MAIRISGTTGIDMGNTSVSNASQVEVQEEQVTPFSGFKNYIINGNFDIWQRGTIHTTNTVINYGSADRWRAMNLEPTNLVSTRQEVSGVVPFQAKYFIRQTVPLNTTTGTVLDQLIEGLRQFSNKTVTLSMWVKGTAGKKICIGLEASYGTGGSPSINESILGSVYTLSGGWEKISITRILPDFINGKTYGTNGNDCLRAVILTQAGSIGISPEVFFQSGTFDIAQVQLEEGSVATPFENRPYGLELSLCQRYYQKIAWSDRKTATAVGQYLHQSIRLPVDMRVTPTVTNIDVGQVVNATFIGIAIFSNMHVRVEAVSNAAGDSYILNRVSSLSAEL